MDLMPINRIKYLRQELENERIDLTELAEIESAFCLIPDSELRDLRENATVSDMLDELEDNVLTAKNDAANVTA